MPDMGPQVECEIKSLSIHDDNLDSIWDGDDSELWSYEKVYEMTGRSLDNKRQREQAEYDKAALYDGIRLLYRHTRPGKLRPYFSQQNRNWAGQPTYCSEQLCWPISPLGIPTVGRPISFY